MIGAPATDVLTTTPGAQYAFLSGNSLAAANTSGVVALLVERDPHLNVARIADALTDTTTHEDGSASINACRALERLTDTTYFARARRSSSDSDLLAPKRVRDAEHVLWVLRVAEEPA